MKITPGGPEPFDDEHPFWKIVEQPGQFLSRVLAILGGLLAAFLGFIQLVWPHTFAEFALALPLLIVAVIVCSIEASPEVGPFILELLPILKGTRSRGWCFILFGCIVEGSTWSSSASKTGGLALQFCGLLLILAAIARTRISDRTSARISAALSGDDGLLTRTMQADIDDELSKGIGVYAEV